MSIFIIRYTIRNVIFVNIIWNFAYSANPVGPYLMLEFYH